MTGAPARPELSPSEWALAAFSVPVGVGMWLLVPGGHPLLLWPALAGILTYLLQRVIRLPLVDGYVSIVQPAFIVLLFAVPLNWVAILIPLGLFGSTVVGNRTLCPRRLALALADAWYCVPPVLILAAWAPGQFDWRHWPVYVAALISELAVSFLGPIVRVAIYRERLAVAPVVLALPAAIDVLLTPFGVAAAHSARVAPEESVLLIGAVLTLVALLGHERAERIVYAEKALRDGLTGLANRVLFDELLDAACRRLTPSGAGVAMLFIDLDHFKRVNDTYGHLAGDTVLQAIADRVQAVVRTADTVARFGGDEFAVLLADPTNQEGVERVAATIRRAVAAPVRLPDGSSVRVTASIGIGLLGTDSEASEVVARADEAMYEAKALAHPNSV
jgi:diguanylate cyclase (GGDEF)-like protein